MMTKFAAHELLEVHEIVTSKNLCLQKGFAYLDMAKDPALKDLIQTGLNDGKQALSQLQQVLGGM
jgi:hypothetical protein